MIGGESAIVYDKADETTKYEGMVLYAKENPEKVKEAVESFKLQVQDTLAKAETFDALDLSVKGTIKVKKGESKPILLQDIPASGKNMIQWFYENCMEPNVFAAYGKLKGYADNDFK